MNLEEMSREELVAAVRSLVPGSDGSELEQMLHDLRVHQIELQMQNQQLRESQAELEQSRHDLAELYDSAPVAYCSLDGGGRIERANLTAAAFFGVARSELLGRNFSTLVVPEDRALVRSHLKRCVTDCCRVTNEVRIALEGALPASFQMSSVVWKSEAGQTLGVKTTLTDISSLKRSEDRLRALAGASARLAAPDALAALGDVVPSLVPSFADLCFVDVITGQTATRAAVAVASPVRRHLVEALKRGPIPSLELTEPLLLSEAAPAALALAISDGPDRATIVAACDARSLLMMPVVASDRVLGTLGLVMAESGRRYTAPDLIFARDLAARIAMALENERLRREAQAAAIARQEALSVVSHELKTPLTGALLNAEALARRAPAEERRQGRVGIEHIRRSLEQMSYLLDDLLDLGSIDARRLSLTLAPCRIHRLLTDAALLLAPQAEAQSVGLEVAATPEELWVRCDERRLLQVLGNVVGNAVKFAREGGRVTLSARRDPDAVTVTVADDGPGMSAAVLRHIFERFWQADQTARQGRGLGLFISKGIIEAHGGAIWVESAAGTGARVHFTLPPAPTPVERP